jgi:cytochrome c oxidase accessory protein FixG
MLQIHSPEAETDTTQTAPLALFAARVRIFQAKVHGTFRCIKWSLVALFLGIYYLAPFIRWERGEGAPTQAILLDIMHRKFYFFFIELWPQEVYYFTGLLLLGALTLFLITTLFGRVWCGYACPQTVWTDLFFSVERFFEGDRNAAMRLAQAPWSLNKLARKVAKHAVWIVIGLATGGAWVLYFNDAPTLITNMLHGHFTFVPTFWMLFLTFSTYLMAGFAREQVCTYMCPYARFQGAMFDEDSLIVAYDAQRGEPRGALKDKEGKQGMAGDCIDCHRCVTVCPVGIDIRNGQQYQCINCGLCIDACNAVMDKIGKPKGLIRYNNLAGSIQAGTGLLRLFKAGRFMRLRVIYYISIIAVVGLTMVYALATRPLVYFSALHQRNPLYVIMGNHMVRNAYTIRISNKTWGTQTYRLSTTVPSVTLKSEGVSNAPDGALLLTIKPGKVREDMVFVDRPRADVPEGNTPLTLTLAKADPSGAQSPHAEQDRLYATYKTMFIAPPRGQ